MRSSDEAMRKNDGLLRLSRREIIEELARQGLCRLSRIKSECRRFERYWKTRMAA